MWGNETGTGERNRDAVSFSALSILIASRFPCPSRFPSRPIPGLSDDLGGVAGENAPILPGEDFDILATDDSAEDDLDRFAHGLPAGFTARTSSPHT